MAWSQSAPICGRSRLRILSATLSATALAALLAGPSSAQSSSPYRNSGSAAAATVSLGTDSYLGNAAPPPQAAPSTPHATNYAVQAGDTVAGLAAKFSLNANSLIWTNQLGDGNSLQIGQSLIIPPTDGVLYILHTGDKLADVVTALHGDLQKTIDYNLLRDPANLAPGTMVMVPGGYFDAPPPPPPPAPTPWRPWSPPAATMVSRASSAVGFIWPTTGYVSQGFHWGHQGIDIASGYGVPEYAAAAGNVSVAGWYYGYGLTVQIEHGGGFETRYGHMEQVLVSPGQYVAQGQLIGLMGCTGDCTGPHLHFEIHINGVPVNPLDYLP